MATVIENDEKLKEVFKAAIIEVLQERGDLVREYLEEIVEDALFTRLIAAGSASPNVKREDVFAVLESLN